MALRTLIIGSDYSGARRGHLRLPEVAASLGAELAIARAPGHAQQLARDARGSVERVVSAGGDGTLHEVVNGLLEPSPARLPVLGLLPAGTGNDVARNLGLGDWQVAIDTLRGGMLRPLDLLRIDCADEKGGPRRLWSALNCGVGYGVEVVRRTSLPLKAAGGPTLAYLWGTLSTLATWDSPALTVETDTGGWRGRGFFVAICNGERECGGTLRLAPEARLDDGLAHLLIVPRLPRVLLASRLGQLARGSHINDPRVVYQPVRWARVSGERRIGLQSDGEVVGYTPARVELAPGALSVVQPA